ncbi:flagellin N-terminal helical domain-containing protein [Anaeromicrobium sediminis]|uniref:Flagellin n=1 Tax=Anaeromicrobium sediminis TaxID=1478221 RepID=A0A267MKQ6_9FIRM|nr:flagellin [Anaeromicrobium sediminis]PAB59360.1 flagellin [Anaeromicrobium sediminis]
MRIRTNLSAMNAHRLLSRTYDENSNVLERLSSGKRINKASDDASGMAMASKMHDQIRGLRMASQNALDGISLVQTAEGALTEMQSMSQRIRELGVQGANGTLSSEDKGAIQNEIDELVKEMDRVAKSTDFNKKKLLNKDDNKLDLQVGANKRQLFELNLENLDANSLGIDSLDINNAGDVIGKMDNAISKISSIRSQLGAYQNGLEKIISNIDNNELNLTAALSKIEDADMAYEMSEFTRLNILQQSGMAMLSQANQKPQAVLQLL